MSSRIPTVDARAIPRRAPRPRRKLSVSLPEDAVAYLAARAEERGVGLSTVLAEIVEADRLADADLGACLQVHLKAILNLFSF